MAARGTVKNHEGWRAIPVSVGGVAVSPGDYVVGDGDGVVVVPSADGAEVCDRARDQRRMEHERDLRVRGGESLASVLGLAPRE